MSPLTKLFIVMLVVLSLLQTAAIVVYVNKEDFNRNAFKTTQERLAARDAELERVRQDLNFATQNATAIQQEATTQVGQASRDVNDKQQEINKLNVDLAKAQGTIAAQSLDLNHFSEGLKAAQDTGAKQWDEVGRLRGRNDQLVKETSELNGQVSDLTNKLEVTERERKFLAEQVTEAKGQLEKYAAQIKGLGVTAQTPQAVAAPAGPAISGVVRDVRNIEGMKYATINVGSSDQVQPGMEFKVIDPTTGYMGTIVVDTVTPNEATGRLVRGPHVDQVRAGAEVRTQL